MVVGVERIMADQSGPTELAGDDDTASLVRNLASQTAAAIQEAFNRFFTAQGGSAGPAGEITDVTVSSLAYDAEPTVVLGGTASSRTIALGIPVGAPGLDGDITSVTVTGLAAGQAPTVTLGGSPGARTLAFAIPAGAAGEITSVGVVGGASGTEPSVEVGGTPSARTLVFTIPAGPVGGQGPAGEITEITVTGLAAGASPTIALGGTASSRTIALGIPAGAQGDPGVVDYSPIVWDPRIIRWNGTAWESTRVARVAYIESLLGADYIDELIYDSTGYATETVTPPPDAQAEDRWRRRAVTA